MEASPAPAPNGVRGGPVVVIAASAGGVQALQQVVRDLDPHLAAAVLVVLHLAPLGDSHLAAILGRASSLPVRDAAPGARIERGVVQLAPTDHHLTVAADGGLVLDQTERVQHVRPCADLLFESVAELAGTATLAVVLTGTGRDGTEGSQRIRAAGGRVVVEDPASAQFGAMPTAAHEVSAVDDVVAIEEMGAFINAWAAARTAPTG